MRIRIVAAAMVLMLLASCAHQQSKTKSGRPTFAVEFPEQNGPSGEVSARQLAIPPDGGVETEISGDSVRPLPGTDPNRPPLTLSLGFTAQRDEVVVTAYTIPPESDPLRWSDGHKRLLGSWSAKLNETIELTELKKIGFKPFSLKIVKAVPRPSAHPALISKVHSIKITLADDDVMTPYFEDRNTQSCTVVLHNVASRGIVAYVLSDGEDPKVGIASRENHGTLDHPSIAPYGHSQKEVFTFSSAVGMTPGFAKLPARPQQIIVVAAIFTDGSYEGDGNVAAKLKAEEIGTLIVDRVVKPVIDRIVHDQSMNDEARTGRIKDEIFRIPSQPDDATTRSLQSQFPDLPTQDLVTDLTRGLDTAKNSIWGDLYGYVHKCCQYPPPDHISLAEWWHRKTRDGIL